MEYQLKLKGDGHIYQPCLGIILCKIHGFLKWLWHEWIWEGGHGNSGLFVEKEIRNYHICPSKPSVYLHVTSTVESHRQKWVLRQQMEVFTLWSEIGCETGWIGCWPILSISVTVTIDTILNFHGDLYGAFTLPDTDMETDYYWTHCCLCLNRCLAVWKHHDRHDYVI